jgi:hypothetical protein
MCIPINTCVGPDCMRQLLLCLVSVSVNNSSDETVIEK